MSIASDGHLNFPPQRNSVLVGWFPGEEKSFQLRDGNHVFRPSGMTLRQNQFADIQSNQTDSRTIETQ